MDIQRLKANLTLNTKVSITGKLFTVLEHIVWWQAKSNQEYDKYVLEDETGNQNFRLWISGDFIGLSEIIHHSFQEPLPKELEYEGKKYKMIQDEFCIVRVAEGKQIYKIGDAEIWWDYVDTTDETKGLSLGRNWETWEREDLVSSFVEIDKIIF